MCNLSYVLAEDGAQFFNQQFSDGVPEPPGAGGGAESSCVVRDSKHLDPECCLFSSLLNDPLGLDCFGDPVDAFFLLSVPILWRSRPDGDTRLSLDEGSVLQHR